MMGLFYTRGAHDDNNTTSSSHELLAASASASLWQLDMNKRVYNMTKNYKDLQQFRQLMVSTYYRIM